MTFPGEKIKKTNSPYVGITSNKSNCHPATVKAVKMKSFLFRASLKTFHSVFTSFSKMEFS